MKKYILVFGLLTIFMMLFAVYHLMRVSDNYFHFVMCDVGQGDGMYIRTPGGADIVVDGGPDGSILNCLSENMAFWDRDIDVVFLSHGHSDHVRGLLEVLSRYDVEYFVTQEDLGEGVVVDALMEEVENSDVEIRYVVAGDKLRSGDVVIETMWPTSEFLDTSNDRSESFDKNTSSLTLLVTYGEVDFLLTGDVEEEVVRDVLGKRDVNILKLAHQGSITGTGEETFGVQRPELALISVGENSYGHPHGEVLEILERNGIFYLRTDEYGDVGVVSDGNKFWLR